MTAPYAEKPLPKIGPAAVNSVIPLRGGGYFDPEWNRLSEVRVQGAGLTSDLAAAVSDANMSFSSQQAGQMSLTFQDTDSASLLRSGMFRPGVVIDFRDQHLEIRSIDFDTSASGPVITVKARSRVIGALTGKGHSARGSWGTQDVHQWVLDRCREAGARGVVQPMLGKLLFTRDNDNDSTWGMMQRAAAAVGGWCFEVENTIYFARPTWLANTARARWWNLDYRTASDYTPGLTGQPRFHWAADGDSSLSFELISGDAEIIRPGDGVTLTGNFGIGVGDWVVTQADLPLTNTAPTGVSCVRIKDPEPQPQVGGA